MRATQLTIFNLSLFFALVVGEGRIVIDRQSCTDDDVFPNVQHALDTAMTWARETAEELDRPVSEMDPMIADKTRLLFGNDEQAIELRRPSIGDSFSRIGTLEVVDMDVYSDEWKKTQTAGDITIVCNGDYLEHVPSGDFPDYSYRDLIRDEWVETTDKEIKIKKGESKHTLMITTWPGEDGPNSASNRANNGDIILINPRAMEKERKRGWPRLTEERVQKAVNPDFFQRLRDKVQRFGETFLNLFKIKDITRFAQIQALSTFEGTMLHELTHTRRGHSVFDEPEGACYGWVNAVECHNLNNADNLMWLAISFQLIRHHGYDVTKEGELKKI